MRSDIAERGGLRGVVRSWSRCERQIVSDERVCGWTRLELKSADERDRLHESAASAATIDDDSKS